MTPEQIRTVSTLARKYKISFEDLQDSSDWPAKYSEGFQHIQTLGKKSLNEYKGSGPSSEEPWRSDTYVRSQKLAALATKLEREQRNEAGWRSSLEPHILARFSVEVACPLCRNRLWRSEIEVAPIDEEAAESLEERQRKRSPCRCDPQRRGEDWGASGLNTIFSDRAEEVIYHDEELSKQLPKKEKPDRVFGLESTPTLLQLTDRLTTSGEYATLRTSPFRERTVPLLFPFLVLEAKSGRAACDWNEIEMQTVFSIRTLLEIQAELQSSSERTSALSPLPLVWFLSCKGESWRVYPCFMDEDRDGPIYKCFRIWSGDLKSQEQALQLLLIIDYIFDWARDQYRPSIRSYLKQMTRASTASLPDTDIASLQGDQVSALQKDRIMAWMDDKSEHESDSVSFEERPEDLPECGIPNAYLEFDSDNGAIRDASHVRSQAFALRITVENIDTLMSAFPRDNRAKKFARGIVKYMMYDYWRVGSETLDAIEMTWTGKYRDRDCFLQTDEEFLVKLRFAAYLSPRWEQTRELNYVAVSQQAVDALLHYADFSERTTRKFLDRSRYPFLKTEVLDQFCVRMRKSSQLLGATIARASLSSTSTNEPMPPEAIIETTGKRTHGFRPSKGLDSHELVSEVYSIHKIGRREISESFLRISHSFETEQTVSTEPNLWPSVTSLLHNEKKAILVRSTNGNLLAQYYNVKRALIFLCKSTLPSDTMGLWRTKNLIGDAISSLAIHETNRRDLGNRWQGFINWPKHRILSKPKELNDELTASRVWLEDLEKVCTGRVRSALASNFAVDAKSNSKHLQPPHTPRRVSRESSRLATTPTNLAMKGSPRENQLESCYPSPFSLTNIKKTMQRIDYKSNEASISSHDHRQEESDMELALENSDLVELLRSIHVEDPAGTSKTSQSPHKLLSAKRHGKRKALENDERFNSASEHDTASQSKHRNRRRAAHSAQPKRLRRSGTEVDGHSSEGKGFIGPSFESQLLKPLECDLEVDRSERVSERILEAIRSKRPFFGLYGPDYGSRRAEFVIWSIESKEYEDFGLEKESEEYDVWARGRGFQAEHENDTFLTLLESHEGA